MRHGSALQNSLSALEQEPTQAAGAEGIMEARHPAWAPEQFSKVAPLNSHVCIFLDRHRRRIYVYTYI